MKTYTKITKTIEPCLKIVHDNYPENPREWDNLGYFITRERNYYSPDGKKWPSIQRIVEETGDNADNLDEHIALITKEIEELGEKVLLIVPVYRYEHGNMLYKRGTASGFDYSNCGFYIITDRTANVLGTPEDRFLAGIDGELKTYTSYANGDVYGFTLYDVNGELLDICYGFYDLDDIKEHLPEEYKNENLTDYLVY